MHNTYPEDFFLLLRQIRIRKIDEQLTQIAIISNPHREEKDQKEFVEGLVSERRFMSGEEDKPAEMDRAGVEAFKQLIGKKSKMIKLRQV